MFSTFPGLDSTALVKKNNNFIGLLSELNKETKITENLSNFIAGWKGKGKSKFVYISFGSLTILDEHTRNTLI